MENQAIKGKDIKDNLHQGGERGLARWYALGIHAEGMLTEVR